MTENLAWNSWLVDIDVRILIVQVLVMSLEVLGITQFLKHFIRLENGHSRYYALVALGCTIVCVIMNTKYTPIAVTYIFNMVALVIAVVQLAYEAVINGLRNMVGKAMGNISLPAVKEGEK
ncbi:MAG: hypothetical protein LBU85_08845 [Treponema sp.]|jgi:hypothetical protein|nr:hypothetical protein [Treponema sp.]